ncbi:GlcNAc-transferase family protein [Roseateles koreensis]|uniref:GlcNAc-transferase family protein n=1 Tax=Roseateles koreensis TaxID=2987526 RepID=A0ABT5KMA2_9BURK|nr:GlcNAc-transferase family protein [Roseateles koreensis]MDC8784039.1 GlcNAc-transferase family protein [Roseateles koreensis]
MLAPAPSPDSIFISIASFCDPLLSFTVRSAFSQASRPERVFIGLVDQHLPGQALQLPEPWGRQLRSIHVPALQARGPCWARAIAMSLHQGERWFLQIDSHTWFEPGWDDKLVQDGHRCQALNPRCLITAYPNPFEMVANQPVAAPVTHQVLAHVVKTGCTFSEDHPVLYFEAVPVPSLEPTPAMHIAAGFLFAPAEMIQALPYDPFLYFHGEEQSLALRAWTRGWDIFHLPGAPLYHHYVGAAGAGRPMHWSPELDAQRQVQSQVLSEAANLRLRALLWDDADLGIYGLGSARDLADYAAFSGIDYVNRQIAPYAYKARYGF